jgi:CubicO group peptidase (beta-lactamase class C family)
MNPFSDAITFAQMHEIPWPRDPAAQPVPPELPWGVHHADPAPWNRLLGPAHLRGPVSGVIWRNGQQQQQWGEPERADQTFSVAKTYLALIAGLAHDQGLLPDLDEPVAARLPGIGFDSPHNRPITWMQLLTQTSEWEGSCFGLPDTVDRYRSVSHDPRPVQGKKGDARPLQQPGSYWEYNDVRINQLSLALLHLWKRPLPEVFAEYILQPLGAGQGFQWEGYAESWLELPATPSTPARRVQSVPGGTHWGGGVCISASDQARIGQLLLNGGRWTSAGQTRQLLSSEWVQRMCQPCALAPFYGLLTWLNPGRATFPGASAESFFMVGAGGNYVWIEPVHQAVVVVRWIDPAQFNAFVDRVSTALMARAH